MADAIGACVHCGFCLPTCPTYVTMGEEMDSPRGRIVLMKEALEGKLEVEPPSPTSTTASAARPARRPVPRASSYGDLITPFRARAEQQRERPPLERCAAG